MIINIIQHTQHDNEININGTNADILPKPGNVISGKISNGPSNDVLASAC